MDWRNWEGEERENADRWIDWSLGSKLSASEAPLEKNFMESYSEVRIEDGIDDWVEQRVDVPQPPDDARHQRWVAALWLVAKRPYSGYYEEWQPADYESPGDYGQSSSGFSLSLLFNFFFGPLFSGQVTLGTALSKARESQVSRGKLSGKRGRLGRFDTSQSYCGRTLATRLSLVIIGSRMAGFLVAIDAVEVGGSFSRTRKRTEMLEMATSVAWPGRLEVRWNATRFIAFAVLGKNGNFQVSSVRGRLSESLLLTAIFYLSKLETWISRIGGKSGSGFDVGLVGVFDVSLAVRICSRGRNDDRGGGSFRSGVADCRQTRHHHRRLVGFLILDCRRAGIASCVQVFVGDVPQLSQFDLERDVLGRLPLSEGLLANSRLGSGVDFVVDDHHGDKRQIESTERRENRVAQVLTDEALACLVRIGQRRFPSKKRRNWNDYGQRPTQGNHYQDSFGGPVAYVVYLGDHPVSVERNGH